MVWTEKGVGAGFFYYFFFFYLNCYTNLKNPILKFFTEIFNGLLRFKNPHALKKNTS